MDNRPIGVFDSGVGGLTVARELMNVAPNERIVYFGDTLRVPYGVKTPETVLGFVRQIIRFLKEQDAKAVVIACNTATAHSLSHVVNEFDLPIIGVIKPGARGAVAATKSGRVGVIATEGTIKSGSYTAEITALKSDAKVFGQPCQPFVLLVEDGKTHTDETRGIVHEYLKPLEDEEIDTLVMGCTHFPLLRDVLHDELGEGVTLVDPAAETVKELLQVLKDSDALAAPSDTLPKHDFNVSGDPEKFMNFANLVMPQPVEKVNVIDIEKY